MKQKIEIVIDIENDKGKIGFLHNGAEVPSLFGVNFKYNSRANEFSFTGKRLATNEFGQFFVDEKTKETAVEDINLMEYFSDKYLMREKVVNAMKEVEWALKNVRDTTLFNAKKMIEKRLVS